MLSDEDDNLCKKHKIDDHEIRNVSKFCQFFIDFKNRAQENVKIIKSKSRCVKRVAFSLWWHC